MKIKCILCGKELEDESNVCETCFKVLKTKYPNEKDFEKILQWHKEHQQEMQES